MSLLFEDLGLSQEVLQALRDMGFTQASPIQAQSIPLLLQGKDILGQSQTGTGKTAAFGIPIIEKIDANDKTLQALVLCPTRELAQQVCQEFEKIAEHKSPRIYCTPVYGGESIVRQIKFLQKGVHIVVGTPGRIIDHLERGTLNLKGVKMVVLDEADEMLNMGFRDSIEEILQTVPKERQTILFSATMPREILELTRKYQHQPEQVKVTRQQITNTSIKQYYLVIKDKYKTSLVKALIQYYAFERVLMFCNTKRSVDELVENLLEIGVKAEKIHGDMQQQQRTQVMKRFKSSAIHVLVATDVAARGIDVDNIQAVINVDLPLDHESYVHRIGRTGRAGHEGMAFSMITGRGEQKRLQEIEKYTKVTIEQVAPPTQEMLAKRKYTLVKEKLTRQLQSEADEHLVKWAGKLLEQQAIDAQHLIAAALQLVVEQNSPPDEALEYESDPLNLFQKFGERSDRGDRGDRGSRFGDRKRNEGGDDKGRERTGERSKGSGFARITVSIGRKERIRPLELIRFLTDHSGMPPKAIGDIDIYDQYTSVEVKRGMANNLCEMTNNKAFKGKKLRVKLED